MSKFDEEEFERWVKDEEEALRQIDLSIEEEAKRRKLKSLEKEDVEINNVD